MMRRVATGAGYWYDGIMAASTTPIAFDVEDMSTLFQDTAGTTPVTAVGQTIKAIANKGSGGGFATSSTGAVLQVDGAGHRYFVPPATNPFRHNAIPSGLLGHIDRAVIVIGALVGNTSKSESLCQLGSDVDGYGKVLFLGNVSSENAFQLYSLGPDGGNHSAYQSGDGVWTGTVGAGPSTDTLTTYRGNSLLQSANRNKMNVATGLLTLGDYSIVSLPCSKFRTLVMVDRVVTSGEIATAAAAL